MKRPARRSRRPAATTRRCSGSAQAISRCSTTTGPAGPWRHCSTPTDQPADRCRSAGDQRLQRPDRPVAHHSPLVLVHGATGTRSAPSPPTSGPTDPVRALRGLPARPQPAGVSMTVSADGRSRWPTGSLMATPPTTRHLPPTLGRPGRSARTHRLCLLTPSRGGPVIHNTGARRWPTDIRD